MIASGSKFYTIKEELPIYNIQLNHKLKFRVKMLYHPEQHYAKPKVWSNSGAIIQDLGDEF
jgi:hypothetical protein